MKKSLALGLIGLTLSLGAMAAAPVLAQAAAVSVETTTIADLLANPAAKAIVEKNIPGLSTYEGLEQVKGMTLKQLSQFPQANLTPEKLAAMQAEFDKIGK